MNVVEIELMAYKPLAMWQPMFGDVIVHHGWLFGHWFGLISSINSDGTVSLVRHRLPIALSSMSPVQRDKNTKHLDIHEIKVSHGGKYAILRAEGSRQIWFVD